MNVLCAGLLVCDILAKPLSPAVFERDSSRIDQLQIASGGDCFNVAVNLAKLGVPTQACGRVGDDLLGGVLLDKAAEMQVGTAGITRLSGTPTATSLVLVAEDGERNFAYLGGANDTFSAADVPDILLAKADVLCLGSMFGLPGLNGPGLVDLLYRAKGHGCVTLMDVTGDPSKEQLHEMADALRYLDVFLPSYHEAAALTGENEPARIAGMFEKLGCPTTVIKCGQQGCHVHHEGWDQTLEAIPAEVVDTTGAGDAFVAGYIFGLLHMLAPADCARIGLVMAARCITGIGATETTPNRAELTELLAKEEESIHESINFFAGK